MLYGSSLCDEIGVLMPNHNVNNRDLELYYRDSDLQNYVGAIVYCNDAIQLPDNIGTFVNSISESVSRVHLLSKFWMLLPCLGSYIMFL